MDVLPVQNIAPPLPEEREREEKVEEEEMEREAEWERRMGDVEVNVSEWMVTEEREMEPARAVMRGC